MSLSQEALHFVLDQAMITDTQGQLPTYSDQHCQGEPIVIAEMANSPITNETINKYQKLIDEPLLRDTWLKAMYIE